MITNMRDSKAQKDSSFPNDFLQRASVNIDTGSTLQSRFDRPLSLSWRVIMRATRHLNDVGHRFMPTARGT